MTTDVKPRPRRRRGRRWLITLLVIGLLLIFPIRRALQYAAEPTSPKDCDPLPDGPPRPTGDVRVASGSELPWAQRGGTVNDASCLNRTPVYGVVEIRTVEDVRKALAFAREQGLKVSMAGVRHSMGGQAFAMGALVLDMRAFNQMTLNEQEKVLTVGSGATWHDIQSRIHPHFAVKAMQSTDIFTVGGSISVNAHGMDHLAGSVGRTIRAMRVMLADGTIRQVSRTEDPRLFQLVVGGYGLFGVILDVDLELTDNVVYRSERRLMDYRTFPDVLTREVAKDPSFGLLYAHLSTAPQSFLQELILYAYRKVDAPGAAIPPLGEVSQVKLRRFVLNWFKGGALAMRMRWFTEKYIEPRLESCTISRNQAQGEGEACLVSRNEPMHDSVPYLMNTLMDETDILQEYFIPQDQFVPFIDGLRTILRQNSALLLNASVRVVHREDNLLTYAPEDRMLAIVLYLNQTTTREGNDQMVRITREVIDLSTRHRGRFFLPYQLHYSREQLERAYPEIGAFFGARREFDPQGLFTNTFAERFDGVRPRGQTSNARVARSVGLAGVLTTCSTAIGFATAGVCSRSMRGTMRAPAPRHQFRFEV